jgi:hypothetical protein
MHAIGIKMLMTKDKMNLLHKLNCCRYFLKVTISRRLSDMTKEMEVGVHTLASYPEINTRWCIL